MMLSKEGGENINEDSSDVKLLDEIDAIRKALYLGIKTTKNSGSTTNFRSQSVGKPHLPDTKSNLKSFNEEEKGQKKSLWSKTLMAISHVKNRRFDCCFTLQVHSIEGLPPVFNDVNLCVYWKRRDRALVTHPAKVYQRTAIFEEELTYTCSIYGSRSGPNHSAKYEAKHFLLHASVYGEPELDLGKHQVDLTRLLPLTVEELEEEKSSGKWTTSYKLSGMGKGARLNISFGYSLKKNNQNRGNSCVEFQVSEQGVEVSSNEQFKLEKRDLKDADHDRAADEFLNMLRIEHSSFSLISESESDYSPRERLLRKFEEEALADGCSLFNSDILGGDQAGLDSLDDFDLASAVLAAEEEHQMEIMSENKHFLSNNEASSPIPRSNQASSSSNSLSSETGSEYVSLEDRAPSAMDEIEAPSIEGLRIQSGQSDEDAPSNIDEDRMSESTSSILLAHHANSLNSSKQKSGSRWLVANGMGKSNKHPFMKSKSTTRRYYGIKFKESAASSQL